MRLSLKAIHMPQIQGEHSDAIVELFMLHGDESVGRMTVTFLCADIVNSSLAEIEQAAVSKATEMLSSSL